ncbi:MAG: autotransporter assembly complex family protein [Pseudomonadota bacterium]
MLMPQPANSLELFGRCIIGPCASQAEQDAIRFIEPLRYSASLDISSEEAVTDAVRTASQIWIGRNDPVGGSAALISRAQADYRRILAALYAEGFYAGSISIRINGVEADQLAVGDELVDGVQVAIDVQPGRAFRFGEADIVNTPDGWTRPELFQPGQVARAPAIRDAARSAVDGWRDQGHALAKLDEERITARHSQQLLDVRLGINPGPIAYLAPVDVDGTERVDAAFVKRMTGLEAGAIYSPRQLEQAIKRIERLGVFSVQRFEEGEALNANGQLPISLVVEERKPRRIGIGGTVSTVDGLGVEAFWLHRNLFSRAERLRLDAAVSGIGSTFDYRQFTYGLNGSFQKPGFVTIDTRLEVDAFARRETNETYEATSGGGSVGFSHIASDRFQFGANVFARYGEFERVDDGNLRGFTTAGVEGTILYDTRDKPLDASEGFFAEAQVTGFHEFNFSNSGARFDGEVRYYQRFTESDRFVLAARLRAGSIFGLPVDETPDDMLFYAGGGGSVRGYGFRNIAVIEADGTQRGGRSRAETSLEARMRFTERLGAVAFMDAGSVSDGAGFNDIDDWRVGVGAGLRYDTGLGPLRLDVAFPLNRRDGDPFVGIYAGIGQAF